MTDKRIHFIGEDGITECGEPEDDLNITVFENQVTCPKCISSLDYDPKWDDVHHGELIW